MFSSADVLAAVYVFLFYTPVLTYVILYRVIIVRLAITIILRIPKSVLVIHKSNLLNNEDIKMEKLKEACKNKNLGLTAPFKIQEIV